MLPIQPFPMAPKSAHRGMQILLLPKKEIKNRRRVSEPAKAIQEQYPKFQKK
jgi:hypothetical protein